MAKGAYIGVPEFVQSVLNADGALGGSAFAVYASNYHSADYAAYKAFNGKSSDGYSSSVNPSSQTIYLTFYNPVAIKVSAIAFTNVPSGLTSSSPKEFSVQGGNDNSTWTTIGNFTNTNNTNGATWSVNLSGGFYKYHRLIITSANTTQAYMNIGEIAIEATQENGVARKIKKGYVGVENLVPRALPEGYTQLSHIEATGAQYFDTKFKPNQNTRVVMDIQMTSSAASQFVFGCRTTSYTENFILLISSENSSFRSGYGSSLVGFSISDLAERYSIDHNKTVCKMSEHSVTHSAQTFQSSLTLYLCAANEGGTAKYFAKMKMWPCLVYDNGTLVRDYVPCKNASGVVGLYDMVNGTFGGSATSTAFVAGDNHKSVARRIRKEYIGIGGVARPCWSGGKLAYYGTITPRSGYASGVYSGASMGGSLAAFHQGDYNNGDTIVDVYNASLTKTTFTKSVKDMFTNMTATNTHFFLFGHINSSYSYQKTVNAFDKYGTRTSLSLNSPACNTNGGNFGAHCIIAGYQNGSTVYNTVQTFNASLTRSDLSGLSTSRGAIDFVTAGSYIVLGGGYGSSSVATNATDAYNSSLTKVSVSVLSKARCYKGCASVGSCGLFAGGRNGNSFYKDVDVFDGSLTKTAASLSTAVALVGGVGLEGFAVFAGGIRWSSSDGGTNIIQYFDESLTLFFDLKLANSNQTVAARVGNYGLVSISDSKNMEAVVVV